MNDTGVKQQIVEGIKSADTILVTVGQNPSVDELSAALGLTLFLNDIGKHATAVVSGDIPPAITFLKPEKTFENSVDSLRDFVIALDKEKADHLRYKVEGDVVKIFITPYRTVITQKDLDYSQGDYNVEMVIAIGVKDKEHLDKALAAHGRILHDASVATIGLAPSTLGTMDWNNPESSSLSELATGLVDELKSDENPVKERIASALLTGVVAATDRFSNDKTTANAMTVSAQLMALGANQQLIAAKLREGSKMDLSEGKASKIDRTKAGNQPKKQPEQKKKQENKDSFKISHRSNDDDDTAGKKPEQSAKREDKPAQKQSDSEDKKPKQPEQTPAPKKQDDAGLPPVKRPEETPAPKPTQPPQTTPPETPAPQTPPPLPVPEPPAPGGDSDAMAKLDQLVSSSGAPAPTDEGETARLANALSQDMQPEINGVRQSNTQANGDGPAFGGTLNATTHQAAEDKRANADKSQNQTILSHGGKYVGNGEPTFQSPLNGVTAPNDEPPRVDPLADAPASPTAKANTIEPLQATAPPLPPLPPMPDQGGVPATPPPPPTPDFSQLPPMPPQMPDFMQTPPADSSDDTLPPEDPIGAMLPPAPPANDPSPSDPGQFKIPGA